MGGPKGRWSAIHAPAHWQRIEVLSDLHLDETGTEATWAALRAHLQTSHADAIFILGDLFEAWVGDDLVEAQAWARDIIDSLAATATRCTVGFLPGNRDFLLGTGGLLERVGILWLDDPCTLEAFGQRWVLSHGDAACLDDLPYQRFRAQVRSAAWQQGMLAQSLEARLAYARKAREASRSQNAARAQDLPAGDLDPHRVAALLEASGAQGLVHGHTHRPACHALPDGRQRWVLSDWDLDTPGAAPRAEVLCLDAQGWSRQGPSTALDSGPR